MLALAIVPANVVPLDMADTVPGGGDGVCEYGLNCP